MARQTVVIRGTRFVMVEGARLRALEELARTADRELPPPPQADAQGNRPGAGGVGVRLAHLYFALQSTKRKPDPAFPRRSHQCHRTARKTG